MLQIPLRKIFLKIDFIKKINITAIENKVPSVPALLKRSWKLRVLKMKWNVLMMCNNQQLAVHNQKGCLKNTQKVITNCK